MEATAKGGGGPAESTIGTTAEAAITPRAVSSSGCRSSRPQRSQPNVWKGKPTWPQTQPTPLQPGPPIPIHPIGIAVQETRAPDLHRLAHRPLQTGGRFSTKAATPSRASAEDMARSTMGT